MIKRKPIKDICSVSDYVKYVTEWKIDDKTPTAFRGQSFYGWSSNPKIFRPGVELYDSEDLAVRDIVSVHPGEFESDKTMFDRLVRMQHYGLPTRLLDVTINPLVALWFASEEFKNNRGYLAGSVQAYFIPKDRQRYYDSDRVSCMANLANIKITKKNEIFKLAQSDINIEDFNKKLVVDELLYNIQMEKGHFRAKINPNDLMRPVYVKPKLNNKRIIAQSGAFLLYGARKMGTKNREVELLKTRSIAIPHDAKSDIRKELEMLGIHASTLFPEIDKTAEFIANRYKNAALESYYDLI
ncbi:FRG domain-containing protein [Pectobacterium versatile]|uniref:FRG domain-containing protein n=1 Tax=Pectobacterium versatile TaxID=2488639 RepID=UPI0020BDF1DD|nr:FRG domain-containing protein [Pectobacterium versatile]